MHILIVAPEQIPVPPVLGGSVEICIYAIARELAKQHQVTIISRRHPRYGSITRKGNLTMIRVAARSPGRYLREVVKAMEGKRFDWIQVDNRPHYAAEIKAHFPDARVSLFLHSLTFVKPPYASLKTTARQLARVDRIIANSSSLKKELTRLFPQQASKIHKVLLGTDLRRFRPPTLREASWMRRKHGVEGGFNVLFVGRLTERKGVPVLIRALRHVRRTVPGVRLIVAGDEQRKGYRTKLKKLADKLGVPAVFLGTVPHNKLHQVYWLADCFVCPSQKHEAFGLVNVEAMASGVPVIASANGGIKEVVRHGRSGILVRKYRDPRAFAVRIARIAKRQEASRRMTRTALDEARVRFSWSGTAKELQRHYVQKL